METLKEIIHVLNKNRVQKIEIIEAGSSQKSKINELYKVIETSPYDGMQTGNFSLFQFHRRLCKRHRHWAINPNFTNCTTFVGCRSLGVSGNRVGPLEAAAFDFCFLDVAGASTQTGRAASKSLPGSVSKST